MANSKYVAFYKPYGVLTAFTDEEGRETLKSFVAIPGIYPAGRLDMDSEGLLLLTDDGDLAHRLTDPQYNHPKIYLVQVEGTPTSEALGKLEGGVEVKGQKTRRCKVLITPEPNLPPRQKPVTPHGPTSWLRIELREGMKRQIRHMTAAIGLPTLRLVRIAIGPISLNDLQPGEWRYLSPAEVGALKQVLRESSAKLSSVRKPRAAAPSPKAGEKPATSRDSNPESRYRSGVRRRPGR